MKLSLLLLSFFTFLGVGITQNFEIKVLRDTYVVRNVFKNLEQVSFDKKYGTTESLDNYYWQLYSRQQREVGYDDSILNIKLKLGDICFGIFMKAYTDSICKGCGNLKKEYMYWYLMNYYFSYTALLYTEKDSISCPCYVRKIHFPDAGMYTIDSSANIYCAVNDDKVKINYKNIYFFSPLLKKWKKFVSNWDNILPTKSKLVNPTVTHHFDFHFNNHSYSHFITFDSLRTTLYNNLPALGKDKSVIDEKLDPSIDTSLVKFLTEKTSLFSNDADKINFILSFVQQYIENKTDYEMFKILDKTSLPEETLYRKVGDCEDKAFLLAKLFDKLLKRNKVILLIYKSHIAVGVSIPHYSKDLKGQIRYKKKDYFICETTSSNPFGVINNSKLYDNLVTIIPIK